MSLKQWIGATCAVIGMIGLPIVAHAQSAAPTTMVVISPGGQLPETLKKAFEPFEKKNNVQIQWVSAGSATEVVAKVAATKAKPDYDVAFLDDLSLYAGSLQGLWAPIDPAIVTNLKDLQPAAIPATRDGIGYAFFYGGMFYRTDVFEKNGWPAPTSWSDLLRPEYCGRAGFYHPNIAYGLHLLVMLSGGDINKINTGIERIAANKKCIPVMDTAAAKFEEKVQLGDYIIGNMPAIRAIPLIRKGVPIKFVVPKEGVVIAYAVAAAVKNDAQPARVKLAEEFCNWLIGPFAQETLMNIMLFNPSNTKVAVPKELLDAGILSPEKSKDMVTLPIDVVVKNRRDWVRQVDRILAQ